jgi:hypothetical protein
MTWCVQIGGGFVKCHLGAVVVHVLSVSLYTSMAGSTLGAVSKWNVLRQLSGRRK